VPGDFQFHIGEVLQNLGGSIEEHKGTRQDVRRAGLEVDAFNHACELLHFRGHLVGTTVSVLVVVEGLGLIGALVDDVGDAVAIVVGIRAAVLVLEPVLVLGFIRTLVQRIGDAVAVVVEIRAAILVLEAVLVLRLIGALVDGVRDAVAIVVEIRAAVLVLEPVLVLRLVEKMCTFSISPKLTKSVPRTSKSGPP
jgi:hypothetical protein